jgi:hypothetical protein
LEPGPVMCHHRFIPQHHDWPTGWQKGRTLLLHCIISICSMGGQAVSNGHPSISPLSCVTLGKSLSPPLHFRFLIHKIANFMIMVTIYESPPCIPCTLTDSHSIFPTLLEEVSSSGKRRKLGPINKYNSPQTIGIHRKPHCHVALYSPCIHTYVFTYWFHIFTYGGGLSIRWCPLLGL